MERRHQVFISSTFSDLKKERAEIVQALLELDCFPAGMEIFPAANDAAWELIKGVVDDSDYYCLIIGGRYGSLDERGISYTEREYDYAAGIGKPIVAFLHGNPGSIAQDHSEASEHGREKLIAFRNKVETAHHCKYWDSPEDLGGKVSRAIVALRKSHPAEGWVPGSYAADESSRVEVANLRARIAELEAELAKRSFEDLSPSSANIAGGEDHYKFRAHCVVGTEAAGWQSVDTTWDNILKYVGPTLLPECSEEEFVERLKLCVFHVLQRQHGDDAKYNSVVVPHVIVDQIKIQLRALGHMVSGTKRRAVSDKKNYWKLTQTGESRLLSIQALGKPQRRTEDPPTEPAAVIGLTSEESDA